MAALDTNVLIRFLVRDDAVQAAAAERLIRACVSSAEALFVPVTVVLELEWVLRSRFGFDKPAIVQTLAQLLSAVELQFESESAVELALKLYREGTADFSDALHAALADRAGEQPLWTFDRAAAKLPGTALVSA